MLCLVIILMSTVVSLDKDRSSNSLPMLFTLIEIAVTDDDDDDELLILLLWLTIEALFFPPPALVTAVL
jgi:hypothetical protein